MGHQELFNLLMQVAAVHQGGEVEFEQGVVDREALVAGVAGQTQELAIDRGAGSQRRPWVEPAVGPLHQAGDQQEVEELANSAEPEGEEPEQTREGFAVVHPVDAANPHQRKAPQPVTQRHAPSFFPEAGLRSSWGTWWLGAAHSGPRQQGNSLILRLSRQGRQDRIAAPWEGCPGAA